MDFIDDFLNSVGYGKKAKKVDSSRQLENAQRRDASSKGTPAQEEEARRAGFKSHVEYMAYLRQRQQRSGGSTSRKAKPGLTTGTASHPISILNRVDAELEKANKPKD